MNKEFLEDYGEKEYVEVVKYQKKFLGGEINLRYPENRFKVEDPIIYSDPLCFFENGEKIWNQIPLAGTLVVVLKNTPKDMFLNSHGFEVSDIPKLIDIAKETGRVAFGLNTHPVNYSGLDHLDPIFQELNPPLFHSKPPEYYIDKKTSEINYESFGDLGRINYFNYLKQTTQGLDPQNKMMRNFIDKRFGAFERLKVLKMNDEFEELSNLMIDDPEKAEELFQYYIVVLESLFDPLTSNKNISMNTIQKLKIKIGSDSNFKIPEIGNYLLKKTLLNPSTYYGCIEAINHYKQNDLYKTMNSLSRSIKNYKDVETIESVKELEEILDNSWKDAKKLGAKKEVIRDGISVVMGSIGLGLGLVTGGIGLLAGFGFNVLDRRMGSNSTSISDKIIKAINPNYLVTIYEYQQKYQNHNENQSHL